MGVFGDKDKFEHFMKGKGERKKKWNPEEHGGIGVLIHDLREDRVGQRAKEILTKIGSKTKEEITELKELTDVLIAKHKEKHPEKHSKLVETHPEIRKEKEVDIEAETLPRKMETIKELLPEKGKFAITVERME